MKETVIDFIIIVIVIFVLVSGIIALERKICGTDGKIDVLEISNLELRSQKINSDFEIKKLKDDNAELVERLAKINVVRAKVTAYSPCSLGINSDSNPNITATMTLHKAGYTCAISTDLVKMGFLGSELYINGFGVMLANDRLAPGIRGLQVDLCKGSYKDAMAVGVNHNVLVTRIDRKFINRKIKEN